MGKCILWEPSDIAKEGMTSPGDSRLKSSMPVVSEIVGLVMKSDHWTPRNTTQASNEKFKQSPFPTSINGLRHMNKSIKQSNN